MRARRCALAATLCALSGCYTNARHGGMGDLRGALRGVTISPAPFGSVPEDEPLSDEGTRVRVVDAPPPGCTLAGFVTGTAGPVRDAELFETGADLAARLPGDKAIVAARNAAGRQGLSAITLDAWGIVEEHNRYRRGIYMLSYGPGLFALVYGRAWKCPR